MLKRLKEFFLNNKKLTILILLFFLLLVFVTLWFFLSREEQGVVITNDTPVFTPEPKYERYSVEMEDSLVRKLNLYGDVYPTYRVNITSHLQWAQEFANSFVRKDFQYREQLFPAIPGCDLHTLDQSRYYWENDSEYVLYDLATDMLSFSFETPVLIPNVQINPRDLSSVEKALVDLNKEFFSETFEYEIQEITIEGNFYKIEFLRTLDDLPILLRTKPLFLLVTPDGRLKEGSFLLAEFDEQGTKVVSSGQDLLKGLRDSSINKSISFEFLDNSDYESFDDYFFFLSITGDEYGQIKLSDGALYYHYQSKFDEIIEPKFLLLGEGFVEIEGGEYGSSFEVLSNSN